jgi:hypothetical protein
MKNLQKIFESFDTRLKNIFQEESKKDLRKRVKTTINVNKDSSVLSKNDIKQKMIKAYNDAQIKNKESKLKTGKFPEIMHMISLNRINDLEKVLSYLLFPYENNVDNQEISVSLNTIWDYKNAIILKGYGKLEYYFDVDIYSTIEPYKNSFIKIPNALQRRKGEKDWDESFVKLKNIKWESISIGEFDSQNDLNEIKEIIDTINDYYAQHNNDEMLEINTRDHDIQFKREQEQESEEYTNELMQAYDELSELFEKVENFINNNFKIIKNDPELYDDYKKIYDKIPQDNYDIYPERLPEQTYDEFIESIEDATKEMNELYFDLEQLYKDMRIFVKKVKNNENI